MKQIFFHCCAAALVLGFTACSNSANDSAAADSSSNTTTTATTETTTPSTTTTSTSEGNYAALADSVERNSQQGYYVNPKTGKPYSKLSVDRSTGRITDDAGQPVWRYVDNRNWWVYGGESWGQVGEAKMEGEKLMYKGDSDKWVDYDTRWKTDDSDMERKWKSADGETKIKVEKDGDMKIKSGDEKIKIDEDGIRKKN